MTFILCSDVHAIITLNPQNNRFKKIDFAVSDKLYHVNDF